MDPRLEASLRGAGLAGLMLTVPSGPAAAECLGSCMDALATAVATVLTYGAIGIVLLIMLIVRKWRRAGLWSLAVVAVVALGVPLASQAWQAWRLWSMERREVVGAPPVLSGRVPLLIPVDGECQDDLCTAVLLARGAVGATVLPPEALAGLDLTAPLVLADLPLERWVLRPTSSIEPVRQVLTMEERQAVAARIDYLVITADPFYLSEPGAMEAALAANPALGALGQGEVLRLAMAPLDPAAGRLTLTDLQLDLLDLSLIHRALALPLAPLNRQSARNTPAGVDAVIGALCPPQGGETDWPCQGAVRY